MEVIKLVHEILLTSAYSMFTLRTLHNIHFRLSKLMKEHTFTYLSSDAIRSPPGKIVHERRPLCTIRMSILRGVNSILAAIKQNWSLPGLRIDFLHRYSSLKLNGVFLEWWSLREAEKKEVSCC